MDGTIRIAGVVRESIVDGPGLRFTVFCQGCPHGCKGCHNVATHDFSGGYDCEMQKILDAIDQNPLLDGVTFSGGEILEIGDISLEVIHTPGHTKGACCFKMGDILFTGDTLFAGSVGRWDLETANVNSLVNSVKKVLYKLE